MTKIRYPWIPEYSEPRYWDTRAPLWIGMPRIVNFYIDLNDNKIRRFLSAQKGWILDAGCGSGRFLQSADLGVDFSRGMLDKAKKTGRSLVRASLLQLPFQNHKFSMVFSIDVLLHIRPSEQDVARRELQRVGKKVLVVMGEHRTVFPIIYYILQNSIKKPRRVLAYLALLLAFPIDRFKNMHVRIIDVSENA